MKNTIQQESCCADINDTSSISVNEAQRRIKEHVSPIKGKEKLSLRTCLNRMLAKDIYSPIDVPAHTNSAMDGYAIAAAQLPDDGVDVYEIVGTAYAGVIFSGACHAGQVVRIMTGAVIPQGCDTIIMQEHTEKVDDSHVKIGSEHSKGQNIRLAGEDIGKNKIVFKAGRCVTPADLGVLASLGIAEVMVFRRPRVAFFSTGDELRSVGDALEEGQIYDSNRYTLFGMLKRIGVEILDMGVINDDPDAMREAFVEAAKMSDVIISSGGVSVGEADYIKPTLNEIGETHFWKIGMKPGRPLTFGKINNARFFGLPGNPVAVMVTFYQFVQPALHYLASGEMRLPITVRAITESPLNKRSGRVEFQRGIYEQREDGRLSVKKTGRQGSGILSSMSSANCFIVLPEEMADIKMGDEVTIQPFEGLT